jgi:hypothetical protein
VKRLTAPARTFMVMMIAALCALKVFFVPPRNLWKDSTIVQRLAPERKPATSDAPVKAFGAAASGQK